MRLPSLAALLASTALLAGCGGSSGPKGNGEASKTADQVLADAQAAATGASTVHVVGAASTVLALDLHLVAGQGGSGSLKSNGLSFDLVRIGPAAYFKGDSTFWNRFGGATTAQLLQGRWLKASAVSGRLSSFTPLTDIVKLFKGILGSHGALKLGPTTTIRGLPAITVIDTSNGGDLYVATTGTPYPLEIRKSDGSGTIDFEDWDAPFTLHAPANPVDMSKLGVKP